MTRWVAEGLEAKDLRATLRLYLLLTVLLAPIVALLRWLFAHPGDPYSRIGFYLAVCAAIISVMVWDTRVDPRHPWEPRSGKLPSATPPKDRKQKHPEGA